MRRFIGILKKCILFKGIEEDEILSMLSCLDARVVYARKGEYIFSEGEAAKYVGIVLTGEAQIVRNDFFGNRTIVAAIMPGELFGESFACAEVEELPVSVAASENSEIMLMQTQFQFLRQMLMRQWMLLAVSVAVLVLLHVRTVLLCCSFLQR